MGVESIADVRRTAQLRGTGLDDEEIEQILASEHDARAKSSDEPHTRINPDDRAKPSQEILEKLTS